MIQLFQFDRHEIRTLMLDGQPWFVLKDICDVLEIANSRNVAARLEDDEKGVHQMDTLGGTQKTTIINESGLYAVILRSDKPQAKPFRKWVTAEVLPAIRKTGSYALPNVTPPNIAPPKLQDPELVGRAALRHILEELDSSAARFERIEQRLDEVPLRHQHLRQIHQLGQELGRLIGFGKAWRMFNDHFLLASYRDLPACQYENALTFLRHQIISYGGRIPDRLL